VAWTAHGVSPYLNATEDGNYIEGTTDASWMAWFGFKNFTLGDAEIKEVVLEGYTNGSYNEAVDYDIYTEDFTWIGSLYATGEPAWVTPRWIGQTVDEIYPDALTEEGLNNLRIMAYFWDPEGHGGAGNIIDALRLKVWYQEPTDVYTQRLREMQNCTIDALTGLIRSSDVDTLESECYTITSAPGFHVGFIGFNIRPDQSYRPRSDNSLVAKVLADVWFRFALFKCYDQDNIIASIYGNLVTPVNSLVPPALGGWANPNVPKVPYNPGDKYGSGKWPSDDSACGVLRYANYTYDPVEDNWRTPTDWGAEGNQLIPELKVFTPTYDQAPTSADHGARWVADCNAAGLTCIKHEPTEFSLYIDKVYDEADFDMFMIFFALERFPDHVYNFCHSSQDCQVYPGAYNSAGINDTDLDLLLETMKFSLNSSAGKDAAWEIQERLYDYNYSGYAFSYMTLYSRMYFNAFNPGLRGIVNSPGYGSDNQWTFLNMHWEPSHPYERTESGNSTVIWCLDMEPEMLNPCYATTKYAWEILDRIYDPLIAIDPYNHGDLAWLAKSWTAELFTGTVTLDSENRYLGISAGGTVDISNGMKVDFNLNASVEWQDGNLYTTDDAEFNLEFLRNNEIPGYVSMWQHLVDVQVINSTAFTVYSNVTSSGLLYDLADDAALLPPPVWGWLDGKPVAEILNYDPSENTTAPLGAGPRFGTDACPTQLYGTGPFVFAYYDPIAMYTDLPANRYYFKETVEIAALKVEMFWSCGDVNRDGVVSQIDYDRYILAFGSEPGAPNWDPDCDLNSDGIVDGQDGVIISYFMGKRREYPAEIIDVAILDVNASPTAALPGQEINITVIAKNKGNAGFTTNFTCYYDDTFIDNQTVTNLIPCHNTTIHYIWDTNGVAPGVYTISVNATVLDGVDANLTDNSFVDETILIGPKVSVSPEKSVVGSAGKDFSINITITEAPFNMTWAWEFKLSWNASLLNITDINEGTFLNQSGTWATTFVNFTNQEEGWVLASCTLYEDPIQQGQPLPSGNGTLATINFTVLDLGNCTLHLSDTLLLDYNIDPYTHTTQDGEFEVLLGDINGDGIVDDADADVIGLAYGSSPGDESWNPDADIWGPNDEPDGYINIYDLAMWGKEYGDTT